MRLLKTVSRVLFAAVALPFCLQAQVLDLTIHDYGLAIGDKPRMTGLRLNFRDRYLEKITGVNATIWGPYSDARGGSVNGVALGLPLTGARDVNGALIGIFGGGV